MAELSRIQHVVPAPKVAHDPHRVHRPDGDSARDRHKRHAKDDLLELHEEELAEASEILVVQTRKDTLDGDSHIDIAV